jgi:hypothetical protein
VGKPDKNIPLGRPGSIWENNIKMNLKKSGLGRMDFIAVAQD